MRRAIVFLILSSPVAIAASWVDVTPVSPRVDSLKVDLGSVFTLENTRVVVVSTEYKPSSFELKDSSGSKTGVFITKDIEVLEVDCVGKQYRFRARTSFLSNSSFSSWVFTQNPEWAMSKAAADDNGWFVKSCGATTVRSMGNAQLPFGAVAVVESENNYKINALMQLDGERVAVSMLASDCISGFGSLVTKGKTAQTLPVLKTGEKREDAVFALLCALGQPRAAYLKYQAERLASNRSRESEQQAADERRREILLQYLLNRQGASRPDPLPSAPKSNSKAETVCRYNELSGETRCTTTGSP